MTVKALISVTQTFVGNTTLPTVNARDLHAFLEVKTHLKDWIARRINEYGFEDGKDFCSFLSESSGGRPSKEYALTLDMAKELSMVERNAKGKQAREYFIECERQVKGGSLSLPPAKHAKEALQLAATAFRTARTFGFDQNVATISANQFVRNITGLDLLEGFGQTHLLAANQKSLYCTPTELGQMMGGVPARQVNLLLAGAGLQARVGEYWQPLDAGQEFARLYDTGKRHGNGTPIQQIKWADAVLPLLQTEVMA